MAQAQSYRKLGARATSSRADRATASVSSSASAVALAAPSSSGKRGRAAAEQVRGWEDCYVFKVLGRMHALEGFYACHSALDQHLSCLLFFGLLPFGKCARALLSCCDFSALFLASAFLDPVTSKLSLVFFNFFAFLIPSSDRKALAHYSFSLYHGCVAGCD